MKFHTVIFDLDGTLLDTLDDMTDSVNLILNEYHFPLRERQEIASFIGNGVKNLMKRSLPPGTDEAILTDCVDKYRNCYRSNMYNKTHPFAEIDTLLKGLSEHSVKMAVLSNKPDVDVKPLCRLHFDDYFPITRGEISGIPRKPAPDSLLQILDELRSPREGSLYVGDSEVDILTAANAALPCASVTWGLRSEQALREAGAVSILHSPPELLQLIIT